MSNETNTKAELEKIDDAWREQAIAEWEGEDCEIDADAKVSAVGAEDNYGISGAWVQAWVWVEKGDE
jgi:hypothetical protein